MTNHKKTGRKSAAAKTTTPRIRRVRPRHLPQGFDRGFRQREFLPVIVATLGGLA